MKIYPEKLAASVCKGLEPVYLVSGDETLLVNEATDTIRQACQAQGFNEREVFHTDGNDFSWEATLQSINSMSLFSDRKLVEIRCDKHKPNNKSLQEYCENPNPDTVVLIICPKLDGSTLRTKWFKSLETRSMFIQIWPLEGAQLERWLASRCQQKNLNINSGALHMLYERIEGNLLAANQEIEKLRLIYGDQPVDEEMLADAVSDSARYNVFKLVDNILLEKSKESLRMIQGLALEGTSESVVLWAFTRELRCLANLHEALDQGQPANQAMKQLGIWEKRQGLYQTALKRIDKHLAFTLIKLARDIDLSIKGIGPLNPWDALQMMCLKMCGKSGVALTP